MMKKMEMETTCKLSAPPPPPPPPPLPQLRTWNTRQVKVCKSVTREEIARFWRQKKMEQEDHLFAAIKAAARIRARNLTVDDYRRFEESLEDDKDNDQENENKSQKDLDDKEIRVGIKDWWTKSKYAYLNQPDIQSMDPPKRTTSTYYMPNLCFYKAPPSQPYSLGVFSR
ncbi:Peptide methionine sulfoxide reductase MrsB [Cinnamomum micranthum f. kanehirae]|uniref:Peptide methionine sulfoxide reductase MrsB n=1 Tax=Cinnamomum micranthum f. kanehirae TaxID=337451 RepID=A0A3S3P0W0_9MAGN|nr:Peptide methionine sulfoxide reductase MrsB [Cinnamomum micranthum f. kanehirae]